MVLIFLFDWRFFLKRYCFLMFMGIEILSKVFFLCSMMLMGIQHLSSHYTTQNGMKCPRFSRLQRVPQGSQVQELTLPGGAGTNRYVAPEVQDESWRLRMLANPWEFTGNLGKFTWKSMGNHLENQVRNPWKIPGKFMGNHLEINWNLP